MSDRELRRRTIVSMTVEDREGNTYVLTGAEATRNLFRFLYACGFSAWAANAGLEALTGAVESPELGQVSPAPDCGETL